MRITRPDMTMPRSTTILRRLTVLALAGVLSLGAALPSQANSADFVRSLWPLAQAKGVSRAAFESAFASYRYLPKVMELTGKQPEFSQTVQQYIDRRVTNAQAQKGQAMRREWNQTLTGSQQRWGVQPEIV